VFATSGTVSERYAFASRRNYKADATKMPILVCPPRGQTGPEQLTPGWIGHITTALAEAGYPVLCANMGGTTTHGNAASATAVGTWKTYVQSSLGGKAGKVGLIGSSMGSLAALRFAKANPTLVQCMSLLVPNVNLQDVHDVTRTDLAAEIETAHGGTTGYNTYISNENPSSHTSSWTGFPTQLYYASNDPNFSTGVQSTFGSAIGATVTNLGAVGHDPTTVPASAVVSFFNTNQT
jgi:alpha-beta hydrolase superfamily lysophospholipase